MVCDVVQCFGSLAWADLDQYKHYLPLCECKFISMALHFWSVDPREKVGGGGLSPE